MRTWKSGGGCKYGAFGPGHGGFAPAEGLGALVMSGKRLVRSSDFWGSDGAVANLRRVERADERAIPTAIPGGQNVQAIGDMVLPQLDLHLIRLYGVLTALTGL